MPNGAVIYSGPSRIDGADIVAIVTGLSRKSRNAKTGDMAQVWILRAGQNPLDASRTGADESICGDCPLRLFSTRGTGKPQCYVQIGQAPAQVWKAWQAGAYPEASRESLAELGAGRTIRLGAYGDPYAVPLDVWDALLTNASGWTGYTHQWRRADARPLRRWVMASADSEGDAIDAWNRGWRTFRVRRIENGQPEPLVATGDEVVCPASDEGGKRAQCASCKLCAGRNVAARSVAIIQH